MYTDNKRYTLNQINTFRSCIEGFTSGSLDIHLMNSAGFLGYNDYCCFDNMIRVGGIINGFK